MNGSKVVLKKRIQVVTKILGLLTYGQQVADKGNPKQKLSNCYTTD